MGLIERLTRVVIRFRFPVLAFWLILALAGVLAATRLPGLLSTSLSVPGTASEHADTILSRHFHENPEGTFTVVFHINGYSQRTVEALTDRLAAAAVLVPGAHVTQLRAVLGVVYGDVVTTLDIQNAQGYTPVLRRDLSQRGTPVAYVTGPPAIQYDLNPILAVDLRRGELIALPFVLLVLALVIGLRTALVIPFVFAGCTIAVTLAIVYALAHVLLMVSYTPNLVELIGLGLAIDYSLLIVCRFREEAADATSAANDAIVRTMTTAGRSVVLSGVAVAIGLSAVLIVPVPFIRSLGVAGVVVPLVSMAAALTLQPALLSLLGGRGVRGAQVSASANESPQGGIAFWASLAGTIIRKRRTALACSAVLLGILISPVAWLQLTPGSISGIPQSTQSARGLALMRAHVGLGTITPMEIILDGGGPGRALTQATAAATLRLGRELLQDPAAYIVDIGDPTAAYVDASGRYRRMYVYPRSEFGAESSQQLVDKVRNQFIPDAHFPPGMHVTTGGAPAQGVDFLAQVYESFPWIILLVVTLTYLVLVRAFRSLILPFMALILDAVSVVAAYGLLVAVFRFGIGADFVRPFGIDLFHPTQIEGWIPVFLFAMLFGLSMDYQVFLVTRMREARDGGAATTCAVSYGLERTGRIITAAAVIMTASFSGFVVGQVAGLQEFGVGLTLGVIVDATVVRMLVMPSLMAMLGDWCWWLPAPIIRVYASRPRLRPRAGNEA